MEKMVRMFSEGSELRLDELDQHGCTLVHHCAKVCTYVAELEWG